MEDHEIINLYYDRAQQAITETSGKYNAYCMHIARAILGDEEDAKECVRLQVLVSGPGARHRESDACQ